MVTTPSHSQRGTALQGMTLLELVAVLVILAIVATVAVQSLQPRVEQVRLEQARQLLTAIRQATLGWSRAAQSDGSPIVNGFVADIGRLPVPTALLGAEGQAEPSFDELWNSQSNLAMEFPFRTRSGPPEPMDLTSVRLPCGWRGPYLQLGVGQSELSDSWGRPLECTTNERGQVVAVHCREIPGGLVEEGLTVNLSEGLTSVSGVVHWGDQQAPGEVTVVLLAPDPTESREYLTVRSDEDGELGSFLFSQVPIGLRAVFVRVDGRQLIRYLQVPQNGLAIDISLPGATP